MKSLATLVLVVFAFGLGWWSGHRANPPPPPIEETSARENETLALLQKTAGELNSAATDEERRQKADELLEKIFKLFLVDVSLRMSAAAECKAPSAAPAEPCAITPPSAAPVTKSESEKSAEPVSKRAEENRRHRLEVRVIEAASKNALGRALKELAATDFESGYKASKKLSPEQIQSLIGVYEGHCDFDNGEQPWTARLEITQSGTSPKGKPQYHSSMRLVRDGKVSESSGDGAKLKGYSIGNTPGTPLYVEVGSTMLVLYASETFDGFSGVVYEDAGQRDMKPTGRVTLQRRGS